MKILVLGGGDSTEREISLRSAAAVKNALIAAGYEVTEADPIDNEWLQQVGTDTVIFPILHGKGGEDGLVQKLLEEKNIPFLGSDSEASRICFDKWLTRKVLEEKGIPVARGEYVNRQEYESGELRKVPHVLKSTTGGSSIGTLIVHDPETVQQASIDEIFSFGDKALLEELVAGIEITVPVLDTTALPVIEIRPPTGGDFDYENKYNGRTAEICPTESLNAQQQKNAQGLAQAVHAATGARHFSRTDIIMRPDESMVVLEINTIPGMTDQSLYPRSAAVAGYSMPELMNQFVSLIQRDFNV